MTTSATAIHWIRVLISMLLPLSRVSVVRLSLSCDEQIAWRVELDHVHDVESCLIEETTLFAERAFLLRRLQAQQRPIIFVRDDVNQAVRTLPHIANTLMQFTQQRFTPQLLHLVVDHHPLEAA